MRKQIFIAMLLCAFLAACLFSCKTEVREGDKTWNESVEPFRKTMDMDGYSLSYIDMGSGEPVVLVHGFADSTYSWHKNTEALMDAGCRLIIVDQPGHGRSGMPPEPYAFTVENQAGAVVALTENLGLKDFSLVGHCMGGSIALYIARKYPDKIRKLAVIDPIAYKPPAVQILRLPGMEYLATRYGGPVTVRMTLEDAYYDSGKVSKTMVNEYYSSMGKPGYWKMLVSMEKEFYSPEFYATVQGFSKILRPTLIIWGKQDSWVTQDEGKKLQGDIYNSTLHILNHCGHAPHQECSQSVSLLLMEFLENTGPRPDDFLMKPGEGIGGITLGISRDRVRRLAGKAVQSTKNAEQFEGFIVRYKDDLVSEILVTSASYRTPDGLSTDKPAEMFLASYPHAQSTCYESKSGGHVARGIMRDALHQGIAYDWNAYSGKKQKEAVTIIIHTPGTPACVYGTITACEEEKKPGK